MNIPLLTRHVAGCQMRAMGHTDAAKRVCDSVNMYTVAMGANWAWENAVGRWMAFKLEDGSTDNTLYGTKQDAVRNQSDEFMCMYLRLGAGGMNICEAEIMLKMHRKAYSTGFRWYPDRDSRSGGLSIIPRIGTSEVQDQIRGIGGR
jgi:hypothetical protein